DPSLDALVFGSKPGAISQPTKGSFGWYVVKVNNVTPGNTPKFEAVKAQKQQAALTAFVKSFQDKWKSKTECAKYYIVDLCKNAPKQAAQPGPGTVQQAPEAPQGG
ncbi:MAG: peptidyl-prolyl cis-trans isomerase, partial [Mycobacteriaceae bacterium]|nr:peptidyl-prolyl cis-trans isomerase [Mycobacteriaceae bacterium]